MNFKSIEKKIEKLTQGLKELESNPKSGLLKDKLKSGLIAIYDMLGEDIKVKKETKVEKVIESKSMAMKIKESFVDHLSESIEEAEEETEEDEIIATALIEERVVEDNSFDLFSEILYGEKAEIESVEESPEQKEEQKLDEMATFKLNKPLSTDMNMEEEIAHTDNYSEIVDEELEEDEVPFVEKVREPHADKLEEYRKMPIESLATTIPIGKKFEFIEDLFIGNSDEYSKAIKEIDCMADFKNAEEYLMLNYFDKFGWMEKEKVLNNLFDFVNRRFAA
jgi:hypothetical protein